MAKHILTEAEKIAKYDAERGRTPADEPENTALIDEILSDETPAHLLALRAQIDAETDPDTRRTLILRMADQILADAERARATDEPPAFYGVTVSPNVYPSADPTPILALIDDVPTVRIGGYTDAELVSLMADPEPPKSFLPQRVHEIVRLDRRGLVIIDAEREVFIMTGAEFAEQTGDDNKEGNERAAELAALPIEDRLFASLVKNYLDAVKPAHRLMGQAGLILLAAAAEGIGPEDDTNEENAEEVIAARIHNRAYQQGLADGQEAALDAVIAKLEQRKAATKEITL